jgi:glycosyltransferase involved in cell wall biosynthesis
MSDLIAMGKINHNTLRVAFVAGTLVQGGAEKQLVYMTRALVQAGVNVRVYSLTRGEYYEPILQELGVQPQWIGQYSNPLTRLIALTVSLRSFRPHVLQSAHFYVNLYVSMVASVYNAVGIGCIRSDMIYEMESNPNWGKLLLTRVDALIANSQVAQRNIMKAGIAPEKAYHLPNVIDLVDFDGKYDQAKDIISVQTGFEPRIVVATVGRLIPAKRFDRFITALASARQKTSAISGILIGDGPEMANLQAFARQKGLTNENIIFMGQRDDIPALLRHADIFMLTSDHEGFPNVLLEAMAARLPVITTPAGDANTVVQDGLTGYVVPYDDMVELVECFLRLAHSAQLRYQLGQEGRTRVEQFFAMDGLAEKLLSIYQTIAIQCHSHRLLKAISTK